MFLLLFIINNVSYGTCVTQDDAQDYGIDWDYARLCRAFNPLHINSECDSVDVFCAVKEFMY